MDNVRNLQGLLRLAVGNTLCENAPDASLVENMDPMRREFLECALKTITADNSEITNLMITIESELSSDDDIIDSLCVLRDFFVDTDLANNFIRSGGANTILRFLNISSNNNVCIKETSMYVIAEISQNNPYAQQYFLDAGTIPILTNYLNEDERASSAALHAISAIIRNFEPGCSAFLKITGIEKIITCLKSHHPKVFIRACFLVRTLSSEYSTVRDEFIKLSTVQLLINCFEVVSGFDLKAEVILSTLCVLTENCNAITQLDTMKATDKLDRVIKTNSNKSECKDILEYAFIILNRIKKTPSSV